MLNPTLLREGFVRKQAEKCLKPLFRERFFIGNFMNERSTVPTFASVEEVRDALGRRERFEPVDLYYRDGTKKLAERESEYAQFVGVCDGKLLLFNSGMSTIREVVELVYPTAGDYIACSQELYEQTRTLFFEDLPQRGIKVVGFDSGSVNDIARVVESHKPKLVFAETVANSCDMAVLDIECLISLLRQTETLLVLDNTLPTPSVLPLGRYLGRDDRILVVESGTKAYALNSDLLGIAYSQNANLISLLRARRRTNGSIASASTVTAIDDLTPQSKEEFDIRNRKIVANTLKLARASSEALRGSERFVVVHPNLETHANFEYCSQKFPEGCASAFFISCAGEEDAQFALANVLWQSEIVRKYCDLGQSFGFERTRIWPYTGFPTVRISGGEETAEQIEELGEELEGILSSLRV